MPDEGHNKLNTETEGNDLQSKSIKKKFSEVNKDFLRILNGETVDPTIFFNRSNSLMMNLVAWVNFFKVLEKCGVTLSDLGFWNRVPETAELSKHFEKKIPEKGIDPIKVIKDREYALGVAKSIKKNPW
jgi:hypothetical protein